MSRKQVASAAWDLVKDLHITVNRPDLVLTTTAPHFHVYDMSGERDYSKRVQEENGHLQELQALLLETIKGWYEKP